MNIYQRINEIRKTIAYVKKDKQVGEGSYGYMAVTHDAVTSLIRPALIDQGIVIVVSIVSSAVKDTGSTTGKGVPYIRYEGVYDVWFVNSESPDDRILSRIEAHAVDQGDKAPGKAISYAVKYAMLKLFSLETGEDDEGRVDLHVKKEEAKPEVKEKRVRERVTPNRLDELEAIADEIRSRMNAEDTHGAYQIRMELTDADEIAAMWTFLGGDDSAIRSQLKAYALMVRKKDQELAVKAAIAKGKEAQNAVSQ